MELEHIQRLADNPLTPPGDLRAALHTLLLDEAYGADKPTRLAAHEELFVAFAKHPRLAADDRWGLAHIADAAKQPALADTAYRHLRLGRRPIEVAEDASPQPNRVVATTNSGRIAEHQTVVVTKSNGARLVGIVERVTAEGWTDRVEIQTDPTPLKPCLLCRKNLGVHRRWVYGDGRVCGKCASTVPSPAIAGQPRVVIGVCRTCKTPVTVPVAAGERLPVAVSCAFCAGGSGAATVSLKPIHGSTTATKCSAACRAAQTASCRCACGGRSHGSDHARKGK